MTFGHVAIGKIFLGETVTTFALADHSKSPDYVSINTNFSCACNDTKIQLPIMELVLCTADGN